MILHSQNLCVRNVQRLKKEYHNALDFCGSTNSQAKYLDVEVKIEDYFLLNFAFSEKCRHWINRRNLTDLRRDYFKTEYWMTFLSERTFYFTFFFQSFIQNLVRDRLVKVRSSKVEIFSLSGRWRLSLTLPDHPVRFWLLDFDQIFAKYRSVSPLPQQRGKQLGSVTFVPVGLGLRWNSKWISHVVSGVNKAAGISTNLRVKVPRHLVSIRLVALKVHVCTGRFRTGREESL